VVQINLSIAFRPLIATQQDKFPIDNYETSAWLRPALAAQTELPTPGTSQGYGSFLSVVLSTMP
jgi:hypothetical protein